MKQALENIIVDTLCDQPYFSRPLFGYADLADPIFATYKEVVTPGHMTPVEAFVHQYDDIPKQGTVVVWVLPIVDETIVSNRQQEQFPSKEWAHTRHFGEQINDQVRHAAADFLRQHGYRTVVPLMLDQWFASYDECVSTWSERHAAFAAGLGSFGLSDALITDVGVCHRIGSLVTEAVFAPTRRLSEDPYHRCLYKVKGTCGVCMQRCPAETIDIHGHDKIACHFYTRDKVYPRCNPQFGVDISGCGLCLTKIPCERKSPL
ncbi:MAG: epoxyqueuosine reductase [Desulfuromusa sp.]|nr:epoxyqueuosine reductase [Desulfuromusa sp.]